VSQLSAGSTGVKRQAVISTIRKQAVASARNDNDYNGKLKAEKQLAQL